MVEYCSFTNFAAELLEMEISIELKSIVFHAYHGVSEQERTVGNTFVLDVLLTAPLERAMQSDELEDTINYAAVYEVVKKEMAEPSRLLEHAGGRIVNALKRQFSQLTVIELKLSKLNPPIEGDIHSASVIFRQTY